MQQRNGSRRSYLRWDVSGELAGRITSFQTGTCQKVSLVDISMGGALLEHPDMLRPGTMAFLTLPVNGGGIGLKCRSVRSRVDRYEHTPSGARDLVYRTGIEFLATSESRWGLIEECVLDECMDSLSRETWRLPPEVPLQPESRTSRFRKFCRRWLGWLLPW
jgi:hypothetical protein